MKLFRQFLPVDPLKTLVFVAKPRQVRVAFNFILYKSTT